jgi:hypothetical protein
VGYFKIGGREQGLDGDKTTTNAICFSSLPHAHLEDGRGALRLGVVVKFFRTPKSVITQAAWRSY